MRDHRNQVLLTFDVEGLPPREDIFNNSALMCLRKTLDLLENVDFKGIFFVTASAAEQIRKYPNLVERLSCHEIGYHSSSHSVSPRIIEYTDVASYEEAVAISLERETSHINPETGQIEGKGGIFVLRESFLKNDITCFRAPFFGWSPPHLEALKKLGIKYDFSSSISDHPVSFRGVTFYPLPIPIDGVQRTFVYKGPEDIFPKPIDASLLRRRTRVLAMHPSDLLVKNPFADRDNYRIAGNVRMKFVISMLQLLLDRMHFLQKANLIEVTSSLSQNWQTLNLEKVDVKRIHWRSVESLMRLFNCNPRFVLSHFTHFFDQNEVNRLNQSNTDASASMFIKGGS